MTDSSGQEAVGHVPSLPHGVLGSQGWPGSSKGPEESREEGGTLEVGGGRTVLSAKSRQSGWGIGEASGNAEEGSILTHVEILCLKI